MTQGLAFLHDEGIVHADLRGVSTPVHTLIGYFASTKRPSYKHTILVDTDGSVRLSSFGLASITEGTAHQGFASPTRWLAPELICPEASGSEGRGFDGGSHPSFASDVYACGCVIIEVWFS